jgi:hypothetical protein
VRSRDADTFIIPFDDDPLANRASEIVQVLAGAGESSGV